MDRTSRIGVAVCLALLLFIWIKTAPPPVKPKNVPMPTAPAVTSAPGAISPAMASVPPATAPPPTPSAPEQISTLENDAIKVTFTSIGAAIKTVELKQHKEGDKSNVVLNEQSHANILQLTGWGVDNASFQAQPGPGSLAYTTDLPNGLKWTRTYTLGKDYVLNVVDTLGNPSGAPVTLPSYGLSVGRAEPLRVSGRYQRNSNLYLGCGWLTSKFHLTTLGNFNPGSFFGVVKTHPGSSDVSSRDLDPAPVKWLGAENQFFTVLLTPGHERLLDHAEFLCFNARDASGSIPSDVEPDIEGTAWFPAFALPAGTSIGLDYTLYAGPKEYGRLNDLGGQQGEMMNYGMFSLLILPMLWLLHGFHGVLGNYGVAIILLTLCIKGLTWPLQSFANKSGKRMQALAPKIKELQAKYKESPEKLNTETFALYKEYGVNPFGGCVPALIQMPVFFSLYFMLVNAVELRGQHFLWVHDLTQPDTILAFALPFTIPIIGISHFVLNPLPLMVTGLTMVMMRMTPQMGDPQQAKIAQFMPLIFLFIFYNFAAGLSLYYVINNCVSIIQIYRNLRKPLPDLTRKPKK
jgi:YidC/Oxa1 family membrane protein insertase